MLTIGIKGEKQIVVTKEYTAAAMGSGELEVFATPALVALMEETAWKSIASALEENECTVGTKLEIRHLAATPLGAEIRCESELVEINGRRLTFHICAYDAKDKIGEGTHERFIIRREQFMQKTNHKFD